MKIVSDVKRYSLVAFDNKLNNFETSALLKPIARSAAVVVFFLKDMSGVFVKIREANQPLPSLRHL